MHYVQYATRPFYVFYLMFDSILHFHQKASCWVFFCASSSNHSAQPHWLGYFSWAWYFMFRKVMDHKIFYDKFAVRSQSHVAHASIFCLRKPCEAEGSSAKWIIACKCIRLFMWLPVAIIIGIVSLSLTEKFPEILIFQCKIGFNEIFFRYSHELNV